MRCWREPSISRSGDRELVAEIAPRPDIPGQMRRLRQRIELQLPPSRCDHDGEQPTESRSRTTRSAHDSAVNLNAAGGLNGAGGLNSACRRGPTASGQSRAGDGIVSQAADVRRRRSRLLSSRPVQGAVHGQRRHCATSWSACALSCSRLLRMRTWRPKSSWRHREARRLEARRFAQLSRPRKQLSDTDDEPRSRHVPAAIRRAVRERDGRQCGFVSKAAGAAQRATGWSTDHRHPFGLGGDHSPANVVLLCRDNAWLAEQDVRQEPQSLDIVRDAGHEARYRRSGSSRTPSAAHSHGHRHLRDRQRGHASADGRPRAPVRQPAEATQSPGANSVGRRPLLLARRARGCRSGCRRPSPPGPRRGRSRPAARRGSGAT